ncbi:transcription intermediary factor 1-beta-like [Littorina saxatilis]|uniref:transcription intermediary factor 1-beta-like n=1 Tax=Littorina saxatilis TaxID=31220 RepID=UPI0038B6931B
MAGVTSGDIECPVCHDDFTNPKLLPCNHLACRDCVLSWLQKEGGQGGCPLCRAPILSSTHQGQGQLVVFMVDSLPTDFATAALVESHKVLNGSHVCDACQNNVTATSYCFQCSIKLCKTCTSHHQKFPVLKDHALEQLNKLTAKRLAANRQATCNNHSNRPAELYCSAHQELICMLCFPTNHRSCPEVKAITDVAREKRTELTQQSQRLKEIAAVLTKQMKAAKEKFKGMHKKVNDVFDDLQQSSEKRRQQVHDLIQKEEDATMTSLAEMEKARAAMTSHSSNIDHLVTSAPDDALLQMLNHLKSRLDDLESESGTTAKVKDVGDIVFDSQLLTRLKSDLSKLGNVLLCALTVISLAKYKSYISRHQHHHQRLPQRPPHLQDGGGLGTVTAFPRLARSVYVQCRWDNGCECCYRMGDDGYYDLDLA